MKNVKSVILTASVILALVLLSSSAFVLKEGRQALITQFGRIVGKPRTEAGLHWKIPFIQQVRFFEKRILEWDGDPNQIPTKDKKYIWVDTTARWRIQDLVKFAQTVRTESGAQSRLDSILDGATRDVISKHNLVEAVRNSNAILDQIQALKAAQEKREKESQATVELSDIQVEEEIAGEVDPVQVGREQLSAMIIERAAENLKGLGIEIIDVQLRRIAYEKTVEAKVYDRMISERKRIAEKIRSIGKGEMAKIQGTLEQDLKQIESNAYRESQTIRGKAEAEAIAIYARALNRDRDFYNFQRSLEAYRKTLKGDRKMILSTDSDYLRYLK